MLRQRRRVGGPGRRGPSQVNPGRGLSRLRITAQGALPRHFWRLVAAGLLAVLIIVEVALQVVHSAGPADEMAATTWTTGLAPIVSQSTLLGGDVARIRSAPPAVGRIAIERLLGDLV